LAPHGSKKEIQTTTNPGRRKGEYRVGIILIYEVMKDTYYTNQEIYAMIMNAKETHGNVSNGSMDLYLVLKDGSDGNVVGFGLQNKKEIYTYKDMFDIKKPKQIANHITHEWTHKLGFSHAEITTRFGNRDNSVPYAIGNMIEDLS
jgi:hypothetical protein